MSEGRKSQVEKFQKKWGANELEGQYLKEQEMKREQTRQRAGVVSKAEELLKEQKQESSLFMAMDHESVETGMAQKFFAGIAAEGVKSVLADIENAAYNAHIKALSMQAKIFEEASYNGTLRALRDYYFAKEVGEHKAFNDFYNEQQEVTIEKPQPQPEIQVKSEPELDEQLETIIENRKKRRRQDSIEGFYEELDQAIIDLKNEGIDPMIGKSFKTHSSRNNGLFQRFAKEHKGEKNAWKLHVSGVLNKQQ